MNKLPALYPLKFIPILKEKVWGGNKLHQILHKSAEGKTGESWELSGIENNISKVANGIHKNETLFTLIDAYKEVFAGTSVYRKFGTTFPLLFKFIDAQQDLSVQVHPDDALAKERHNSFGKTEVWYIVQADKEARLILGFNNKMTESLYLKKLSEGKITDILHSEKVKPGDAFFIAPGTVHAIGAGVLLAEIQQTSDITYRIYDWDRPGLDGEMRELHTDYAKKAINYNTTNVKVPYKDNVNEVIPIKNLPYFKTNKLSISKDFTQNLADIDSFVVYMCVEGEAVIETEAASETIQKGETVLIPACFTAIEIKSTSVTLLETYIP